MDVYRKLMFLLTLGSYMEAQLKMAHANVPVDGEFTLDLSAADQLLEISAMHEHWVPQSIVWKRVK